MTRPAVRLALTLATAAALVACAPDTTAPDAMGGTAQLSHKPGHGGNPGGGGGGGGGHEMTLAGGLDASAYAVTLSRDNGKWLKFDSFDQPVAIAFGSSNVVCQGDDLTAYLVDATAKAAHVVGQFAKQSVVSETPDPAHWLRVIRDDNATPEPFIELNFATREPDLLVTLVGGDLNDPSTTRVFELSGGVVAVTLGLGSEAVGHMTCDQAAGDLVTLTIAPTP